MSDEKRLIKDLVANYAAVGLAGRPVYNYSNTMHVDFGLALIQILDLDEQNQVLTTNCWSRYNWDDILLRWNPDDYGGVDTVRIPPHEVWTPDIVLYNHADDRIVQKRNISVVVSHTGRVLWVPMQILKSSCQINILNFPYDEQTCHMKFASWAYDGLALDLHFFDNTTELDISDYVESNEWIVTGHPAKRNVKYYQCCREPYPDLTFTVKLKRIPIYYGYVLILPCILLSTLTLSSFWLPPESPAKILLGMNIFVAFFLLLKILAASTTPTSSSIPLLGAFFCLNMILITLSSVLTVIIINLSHRVDKKGRVPACLRVTIDGLSRLFCLDYSHLRQHHAQQQRAKKEKQEHITTVIKTETRRPGHKALKNSKKIKSPILKYNKWDPPENDSPARGQESPVLPRCPPHAAASVARASSEERGPMPLEQFESDVREIKRVFKGFLAKVHDQDARNRVNLEWRILATIMDRVIFVIYLVTIGVSLFTIFPWVGEPQEEAGIN
jgi:cation transporter family protein